MTILPILLKKYFKPFYIAKKTIRCRAWISFLKTPAPAEFPIKYFAFSRENRQILEIFAAEKFDFLPPKLFQMGSYTSKSITSVFREVWRYCQISIKSMFKLQNLVNVPIKQITENGHFRLYTWEKLTAAPILAKGGGGRKRDTCAHASLLRRPDWHRN